MIFNDWMEIAEAAFLSIAAFALLVFFLRITGKRTLSKWNAFDFVVTVAFGSTLATTILASDVSLAKGATGLLALIIAQYVVTWSTVRSETAQRMVKSEPTLLWYKGEFQEEAMRHERVTASEVRAALRAQGHASTQNVFAVVLETDGSFSVVNATEMDSNSSLSGVRGIEAASGEKK